MNVLKIGKFGSFSPHIDYKDKYVHIIRPLIYLREDLIKDLVKNTIYLWLKVLVLRIKRLLEKK